MIRLQQEVAELRSAMDVRLKELEVKVRHGASVLTKGLADQKSSSSLVKVNTVQSR